MTATPLSLLRAGAAGTIASAAGAEEVNPRLRELGFVPGTRVCVRRRAPGGGPIELELRGYRLCLRRADLAGLWVIATESAL